MKVVGAAIIAVLLLSVLTAQAFARHAEEQNLPTINIPKKDTTYQLKFTGAAHTPGVKQDKIASVEMKVKVTAVKTTGVPLFTFNVLSGSVDLDGAVYALDRGSMTIQVGRLLIESSGVEGPTHFELFGTLVDPLPLHTTDEPVTILKGERLRSALIRALDQEWTYDFQGKISRVTLIEEADVGETIVGESFKGNFVGGYVSDPAFDLDSNPTSKNPAFGIGKFSVLGKVSIDGVVVSDWRRYSENQCAEVTKELVLRKLDGSDVLALMFMKVQGKQCDLTEEGSAGRSTFIGQFTIVGGAGVLEGAKGSGTVEGEIDAKQHAFKGRLDGTITLA